MSTHPTVTRSELIATLAEQHHLTPGATEQAVKTILEHISQILAQGDRVEIRGFGSFEIRERSARVTRNPKTGERVPTNARRRVHFKTGRELRERVKAK